MAIDLQIPIYPDETDIGDLIIRSSVISSLAQVEQTEAFPISEAIEKLIASERQSVDLFHMQSILVSSVWNGNDELFLPSELWLSRNTAKDKPFNYEHAEDDIIGHMTSSYVIDDAGKVVSSETKVEELPGLIHILNQAVLYRHWSDEKLQSRMNNILDEIKEGKWFVSVECLLPDFDYALKDKSGNLEIISRNKKTAFLTKHLRLYGGAGVYDGRRLGRVPRNFIISGKGLVENPANKASVIIAKQLVSVNLDTAISEEKNNLVYKSSDDLTTKANKMNESKELEYQGQIKTLNESLVKLQASISEGELSKVKSELDTVKKDVEAKVQEISVLKASVEALHTEKTELVKAGEALSKEKETLQAELDKKDQEAKAQVRLDAAKTLYVKLEDAQKFVEQTNKMPDETFMAFVEWNKNFMSVNSVQTEVKTEVTITPENKEEILKAAEVVSEPNLTIVNVDKKAEAKKLQDSISAHISKNYVKTAAPKFQSQDNK